MFPKILDELDEEPTLLPQIQWRLPTAKELRNEFDSEIALEEMFYAGAAGCIRPYAPKYESGVEALQRIGRPLTGKPGRMAPRILYESFRHLYEVSTALGGPKDPLTMVEAAFEGRPLPMPVVTVRRATGLQEVLGGNTRWGLAFAAGQNITVFAFREEDSDDVLADEYEMRALECAEKYGLEKVFRIIREIVYEEWESDGFERMIKAAPKPEKFPLWSVYSNLHRAASYRMNRHRKPRVGLGAALR